MSLVQLIVANHCQLEQLKLITFIRTQADLEVDLENGQSTQWLIVAKEKDTWILITNVLWTQVHFQQQFIKSDGAKMLCIRQHKDHALSISNLKDQARCAAEVNSLFMDVNVVLPKMTLNHQLQVAQQVVSLWTMQIVENLELEILLLFNITSQKLDKFKNKFLLNDLKTSKIIYNI